MAEQLDAVDFALAAYREQGEWRVRELAHDLPAEVEAIARALRRFPGDDDSSGSVALIGMDEDYFVVVRVTGSRTRILLSDIGAAADWELAGSAVEFLRLPEPDDDEDAPAGDLDLLTDLGVTEAELAALLDDADLYPDEILSDVARALGFGELFDDAVGLAPA